MQAPDWIGEIEIVSFDCYGTLVDWERGIVEAFAKHVCPDRYLGELVSILERWEEIQFEFILLPYRPYREILRQSAEEVCRALGLQEPCDPDFLANAFCRFRPFPDTISALAGIDRKKVVLSNIDRDLLAATLETAAIELDDVITAEDVRSYKPAPAHFQELQRRSEVPPERILHAAFGFRYDIGKAHELGLRTAWINRAGEPSRETPIPDLTLANLSDLAALFHAKD